MDWYVIKTKPRKEPLVHSRLAQAGFELFLPMLNTGGTAKPLFPSYLFLRGQLESHNVHRLVRYTQGVSYILGDGEGPGPIDDLVVETLKERTLNGSLIEQKLLFKCGEMVRVKRGLLKDLMGMVENHLPSESRVQVLFKWWSTSMRARLKYTDLERAA